MKYCSASGAAQIPDTKTAELHSQCFTVSFSFYRKLVRGRAASRGTESSATKTHGQRASTSGVINLIVMETGPSNILKTVSSQTSFMSLSLRLFLSKLASSYSTLQ